MRQGIVRALRYAAALGAGAAATAAALPVVPEAHHELGPATVAASVRVASGATEFAAPPLGAVSARTHAWPLRVRIALTEVDLDELETALTTGDPDALVDDIASDLRSLTRSVMIRLAVAAAVIGALAGALLPRRRVRYVVASTVGGLCAVVALAGPTAATYDDGAFDEPRFTGALRRAPQVIDALERGAASFDVVASRYETLAGRLSRVMTLATKPRLELDEATAVLHVSDVHSNPLGVEFVERLARAFDVDAIVDTGDLTSFGAPVEARVGRLLSALPVHMYFVPGNHDSPSNRKAIAALPGVTLLQGQRTSVAGVDVVGWADPTFTAGNDVSTEEGNAARAAAAGDVAAAVAATSPDVLAVHDVRLASQAFGDVPLVLAGHTHERGVEERDGTLVLTVGSAGATGLGAFAVEADVPYEAQVVYFEDGRAVAVDYVSSSGLGDEFQVEHRLLD